MKLSNLKSVLILICFAFSFNSSARVLGQFVGDVQKAAKETGNNIDWQSCEDGSGGFNPEHVHKVVETDNKNPCDPNDSLVKKYKNNFVRLGGSNKAGDVFGGTGFLIEGCRKILTVGHVFYEPDRKTKLDNMMYSTALSGKYAKIQSDAQEGPWKSSGLYKDEVTTVQISNHMQSCQEPKILQNIDYVDLKDLAKKGIEFYILKSDSKRNVICAQKCNITTDALSKASSEQALAIGSVEHDCSTAGGNSGAPIFAKEKDRDYLVGLHTGGSESAKKNTFSPVNKNILNSLTVSK